MRFKLDTVLIDIFESLGIEPSHPRIVAPLVSDGDGVFATEFMSSFFHCVEVNWSLKDHKTHQI